MRRELSAHVSVLQRNMRASLLLALLLASSVAQAQSPKPPAIATIAAKTAGMKHMDGFLPLDWDAANGKLYLEIPRLDTDLLYTDSLPYGTGSNDLGLDRGQVSEGRIVRFERAGPKILLVEPNQDFRSSSSDPAEQLAVRQSFPESILWGFTVAAEDPNGAVLVDATELFLHDVHNVTDTLTALHQGAYHVDPSRSTIALDDTKDFPTNTEVEATLTFTTEAPPNGQFVNDVTPDPHAMTIRERQSFIELPPPGFTPRLFNPRSGYFPVTYRDETAPLGDDVTQRFILRHRLIKKDPNCVTACEAVTPIQYYVDHGAPEPVRTALLEGARWWDQAFQAAGWAPGTFRVDLLPEGADPMDVRYNIIQWVHRYTRGWSYGAAIADPRTGEIIKGNVTLGSLRARQDYLIAEGLLAPYKDGFAPKAADNPMLQMVLARIRQLAAHETGHTLGLAHNFAASSVSHGDSVMDYPAPDVTLDANGHIDLSHAYADHIGDWDKVAIDYGYRQFPAGTNEPAALAKILSDAYHAGQIYITDEDARPFGSAQPYAHLWDNGHDPAAELTRVLAVRAAALKNFGPAVLKPGTPMSQLELALVPIYLFHRYQTEAAIKEIGGLDYRYNERPVPGDPDGLPSPEIVNPEAQRKALAAVLQTLTPATLTLSERILKLLPPVAPGYPRTQESFPSHTGLTFDPIAAAESAADLTLNVLFNPQRASRLVEYHARDPQAPSLQEVIAATFKTVDERPAGNGLNSAVSRAVEYRTVEALLTLAASPQASSAARAIALSYAQTLKSVAGSHPNPEDVSLQNLIDARVTQFEQHPETFTPAKPIEAPPGMPIGDGGIM